MPYDFLKLFYIFIKATPERNLLLFISLSFLENRGEKLEEKQEIIARLLANPSILLCYE